MAHQSHIAAIMVSDNGIGDDGVKYLTECISTLKQLNHLDISCNNITNEGVKTLLSAFEKAVRPICPLLEYLDISSNPIQDEGFRNTCKLGQYLKLKILKLNNCRITTNAFTDANKPNMHFDSLDSLDIGNNDLKQGILSSIVMCLNPNLISDLEMENVGVEASVVGVLSSFMDSAKQLKMRRFNLSNCNLKDSQFMRIYR